MKSRLILCGGSQFQGSSDELKKYEVTKLTSWGKDQNVYIRVEDVAKIFLRHLSPRLLDLIEIASYVYTTDCLAPRDHAWTDNHSIEPWSRTFEFVIPVRDVTFWNNKEVSELLVRVLRFLSDDDYVFRFEQATAKYPVQDYLDFSENEDWPFYDVERVLMFSGGLDSLAGALETASSGQNIVLVSHRAAPTLSKRQIQLFKELRQCYPNSKMLHVPVWINKEKSLGREHTQRSRSFLYAALGTIVGGSVRAGGVRFFENGIVSLNLPVADEVLRARASRTTHPFSLKLMTELFGLVLEKPFVLDNPYLFKTKTDVVQKIKELGAGQLIPHSCSCAHTGFFQSKTKWHCGTCSQCIDRRIAIFAAGLEDQDSEDDYVVDVFKGERKEGYEKNMAVDYIRHANELARMSEQEMMTKFNLEISRAVRCFPAKQREVAQKLIEMHKRHGRIVQQVLSTQIATSSKNFVVGELPASSMMMCAVGHLHQTSTWIRFAERITSLLERGIPAACNTHKPKDEPHLQEICDGILRANSNDLVREFPFMGWSSSQTKPDWSNEGLSLWVELKYVRRKTDIRQITEDIAADITKYGDNNRNVLYAVYDPSHLIIDEDEFSQPILKRPTMRVSFIR
jgi:REase_DpnII-MboI/Queuosine biosynthesis protein QueC